jgi:hypothetical protein
MNLKPEITPRYLSLMSMFTSGNLALAEALVGASELIEEQAAEIENLKTLAQAVVGSEHRHPDLCEYYTGGDCDCGIDALAKALEDS